MAESIELATILVTDLVGSTRLATSVGPVTAYTRKVFLVPMTAVLAPGNSSGAGMSRSSPAGSIRTATAPASVGLVAVRHRVTSPRAPAPTTSVPSTLIACSAMVLPAGCVSASGRAEGAQPTPVDPLPQIHPQPPRWRRGGGSSLNSGLGAPEIEASISAFVDHAIGKMVTICRAIRVARGSV